METAFDPVSSILVPQFRVCIENTVIFGTNLFEFVSLLCSFFQSNELLLMLEWHGIWFTPILSLFAWDNPNPVGFLLIG